MNALYLYECPRCENGVLAALLTQSDDVVLFCDSEEHTWLHPNDVGVAEPLIPLAPDFVLSGDIHLRPGTSRPALLSEIPAEFGDIEWTEYNWR